MFKTLFATSLVVALFLCSCSTEQATRDTASRGVASSREPSTTVVQAETSLVAIGDSIAFSVWGYSEFTTRAIVKRSGTITVPLIGEVLAADNTKEQLTLELRRRLAEFIQGEIRLTIEILRPLPRITVLGMVWRQGSFPTNTDIPLLELLSNAGGWTDLSDLRRIRISRQATAGSDGGTIEVNLEWHLESGNIRSLPVVHPGDVVYLPKRENAVRETAEYLRDAFLLFGFFRLFK